VERSSAYDGQSSGYQRDAIRHVHEDEDTAARYRLPEVTAFLDQSKFKASPRIALMENYSSRLDRRHAAADADTVYFDTFDDNVYFIKDVIYPLIN